MIDAAGEMARRGHRSHFVAPRPKRPFLNAGGQPLVLDLLATADPAGRVVREPVEVGVAFELGTAAYRASVLLGALRQAFPRGTAIIPSDDAASWAAACAGGADYPVIGVLHADDEHYYRLAERHQNQVAAFVCVSARVEDTLRRRVSTAGVPVKRIACGIPLGDPVPVSSAPGSGVRLAWAGRIEERQKRVSDLARILSRLVADDVDASLEILGDGPDRPALEAAFVASRVSERVAWTGWIPGTRVRDHMARADVLLLPSNFEGMPVAAMEALAGGCGVVASDRSGLEEFADHAEAGHALRTFRVGDIDQAVRAVRDLLAIDAMARARAARALAVAEFSIQTCVSRYEDLASALVRRRHSVATVPAWARAAWVTSFPIAVVRRGRVWASRLLGARSAREAT